MSDNMAGVSLPLYMVNAFTDVPFHGTSSAVFLVPHHINLDGDVLLKIAVEMNLTETAFIKLLNERDSFKESSTFGVRWFTPKEEIRICGHGTLASASVLFRKIGNKQERVVFNTLSGDLIVKKEGDFTHVEFPVGVAVKEVHNQHADLIKSLGDVPGIQDIVYCDSRKYLLVRLQDGWSRREFEEWRPDFNVMRKSTDRLRGLIVTTRGPPGDGFQSAGGAPYDFVSRCFFPWVNASEHPVTGSAQTVLAHYWSQQLGKQDFFSRQCSSRGGEVQIRLRGDRVELMGKTAFVMEGVMKF